MTYTYKASIIIVNFNGKRYLPALLNSIEALVTPKESFEVVIVDNASSDDSVEYLNTYSQTSKLNLKIAQSKTNQGFAGGNNFGVAQSNGQYIVFLNNDTVVDEHWLDALLACIESDSSVGIVNSKLLFFYDFFRFEIKTVMGFRIKDTVTINAHKYTLDHRFSDFVFYEEDKHQAFCLNGGTLFIPLLDGDSDYHIEFEVIGKTEEYDFISLDFDLTNVKAGKISFDIKKSELGILKETLIQNAGSKINESNDGEDIGMKKNDGEKFNHPYEIDSACGASMMMLRSDFDQLHGFDERYFMYYEDSDLSYRMKELGKRLMFCPYSVVRHFHAGSSGEWSRFFTYYVLRNRLLFIARHKGMELYKREYWKVIYYAVRQRHFMRTRIKAARDSKKILAGKSNVHF